MGMKLNNVKESVSIKWNKSSEVMADGGECVYREINVKQISEIYDQRRSR